MDLDKIYLFVTIEGETGSDKILSKIINRFPGIKKRNLVEILNNTEEGPYKYNAPILITIKDAIDIILIDKIIEAVRDISSVKSVSALYPRKS